MKSVICIIMAACIAVATANAEEAGVHFEDGLSWSQVLAKAKAAGKPVFVDCYATWCGPCKAMDQDVYSDSKVSGFINEHFISVKVQMDATKHDSEFIQDWRKDANSLQQEFNVNAYPTFLFFSPNGKVLHKRVGATSAKAFLVWVQDASDPDKQYYTLLAHYQARHESSLIPALLKLARQAGEEKTGSSITLDYLHHDLNSLSDGQVVAMISWDNPIFSAAYNGAGQGDAVLGSSGRIFQTLYRYAGHEPVVTGPQYIAQSFVRCVITAEEIDANIYKGKGKDRQSTTDHPDWQEMSQGIEKKYGIFYAERLIPQAQSDWFLNVRKDYNRAAQYLLDSLEKPGMIVTTGPESQILSLNGFLWDVIFLHCTEQGVLERAIPLARRVARDDPDQPAVIDTLANLLYKAGHSDEAIATEEKAAAKAEANAAETSLKLKRTVSPAKVYRETIEKMKKGLPTWGVAS